MDKNQDFVVVVGGVLGYCLKVRFCLFNTTERFSFINALAVCFLKYLIVGSCLGRGTKI